jgi:large subunit ribosomal protein L30
MSAMLKITLVRSIISTTQPQRATVRALGLHKLNSTHQVPDRPEIRGMLAKVKHLVKVEQAAG